MVVSSWWIVPVGFALVLVAVAGNLLPLSSICKTILPSVRVCPAPLHTLVDVQPSSPRCPARVYPYARVVPGLT